MRPTILAGFAFDGHAGSGVFPNLAEDPNIVFQIRCPCGGKQFFLLAEADQTEPKYVEGLLMADRYSLTCVDCGKETPLFDTGQHGYNSEIFKKEDQADNASHQAESISKEPKSVMYACANCEAHILGVVMRLEYPGGLFDDPFFAGGEQEFFSWVTVVAICPTCSAVKMVADFECA